MVGFDKGMNRQQAERARFKQKLETAGFEDVSESGYDSAIEQMTSISDKEDTSVRAAAPRSVPSYLTEDYSLTNLFKDAGLEPKEKLQVVIEDLEIVAEIETTKAENVLFDSLAYQSVDWCFRDASNTWAVFVAHGRGLRVVKTIDSLVLPPQEND